MGVVVSGGRLQVRGPLTSFSIPVLMGSGRFLEGLKAEEQRNQPPAVCLVESSASMMRRRGDALMSAVAGFDRHAKVEFCF